MQGRVSADDDVQPGAGRAEGAGPAEGEAGDEVALMVVEARGEARAPRGAGAAGAAGAGAGREGVTCFADGECCAFAAAGRCDLFCKEGRDSEIDTRDVKGWRLKGACTRKWAGFCVEDYYY